MRASDVRSRGSSRSWPRGLVVSGLVLLLWAAGVGTSARGAETSSTSPWERLHPTASPTTMSWSAMAYDAARGEVVLFGGAASIMGGSIDDSTWVWDGETWTRREPAPPRPSARWTAGMAFDAKREKIVLFGGLGPDGNPLGDTWEWDGSRWTRIETRNSPSPRGVHGHMAYDSTRQRVVLFGGGTVPGAPLHADTWEYDGSDWKEFAVAGPPPRVAGAMTFDTTLGKILLFGGGTWGPYFNDTWTWDGSKWEELQPSVRPPARQSTRMIFDPVRGLGLLFGGDAGGMFTDTWLWNGRGWEQLDVAGPSGRCCHAFAFDTDSRRVLLYGGTDSQTWSFRAGGTEERLRRDLEATGRARVYGINFDLDSAAIRPDSKPTLGEIVALLEANSDWKMVIEGHTDTTGTPEHNQTLSDRRAAAVKEYLVAAGIDEARLETAGYGETRPVAPNDDAVGRARNRRVELVKTPPRGSR